LPEQQLADILPMHRVGESELYHLVAAPVPMQAAEVVQGGEADAASDVYAFGLVLFEVRTVAGIWSLRQPTHQSRSRHTAQRDRLADGGSTTAADVQH